MRWDPQKYGQFSDERSRPFFDLVAQVRAESPRCVIDLGCGSGELTATLAERWPGATVIGVDSSPAMIERANALTGTPGSLSFEIGNIADWRISTDVDVMVSNAALQWVPTHRELIEEWAAAASPGTWLAWQVPGNFGASSHVLMRELAESPKWSGKLAGVLRHRDTVAEPADYLAMLDRAGFRAQAWETTYLHVLQGDNPILEWVRGTALRPVFAALDEADARQFEAEYAAQLRTAYPATAMGTIFQFRRIFCVGQKL